MDVNLFYSFSLQGRMSLLQQGEAEFLGSIRFYSYLVRLYTYRGTFVEVYYNCSDHKITEVELLDPKDERLKLYASKVNISDLFRKNKAK